MYSRYRRFMSCATAGAVVGSGLTAACTALSGVTGAAILNSAGHAGYIASEAAQMGAVGGAILGGASGAINGGAIGLGFFDRSKEKPGLWETALSYTGGAVVGGLIGYGVLDSAGTIMMELGQTAASFAVGGAVTMIPVGVTIFCIAVPIVCAMACIKAAAEETPAPGLGV